MKITIALLLIMHSMSSYGQTKECGIEQLSFKINPYPVHDTLGDLILTSNAYRFTKLTHNVIFINKRIDSSNYSIEGADICYYKHDTVLIITPTSPNWNFLYKTKGNVVSKEFKAHLRSKPNLLMQIDNRIQDKNKDIVNFSSIDSLSFILEKEEYEEWYPIEDFNFTIKEITISLIRNKRPVAQKSLELNTSFYIRDILKKARPGDRLIISYYPQRIDITGDLAYMSCGRLASYLLGRKK